MKRLLWIWLGRFGGYVLWPAVFLAIPFTTRARVLVVHKGKVLMVQGWLSTGYWACPGGGKYRTEAPDKAVVRELEEEVGLAVSTQKLRSLGTMQQTKGHRYRFHAFVVELQKQPKLHLQKLEIADAVWVKPSHLSELKTQQHVQLLLDAWRAGS